MTLNRRQFLGASALVAGAIVMTPFGPASFAGAATTDPPVDFGSVSGADGVLDAKLAGLAPYVADAPLRQIRVLPGVYKRTREILVPAGVKLIATGATFIFQKKTLPARGEFDALLRIAGVTDVSILGGVWDANKKIIKKQTEWRHAIAVDNSKRVKLESLYAQNAKGDGIYIGTGAFASRDVTVTNVHCLKNARCGLAITACDGFSATNSRFYSNSGEAPEAGVVIEPHDNSTIDNISFLNCQFYNNASRGFHVVMHVASGYPVGDGIRVRNCTMTNNGKKSKDKSTAGIALLRPRKVAFENCYSAGNQYGAYILGRRTGDPGTVKGDVVFSTDTRLTGNRREGLLVQNSISSLVIDHSRIWNNSKKKKYAYDGLRIKQGANVLVTDSAITTKHRYGVYTDKGVTGVKLTRTNLTGNRKGAYRGPGITLSAV